MKHPKWCKEESDGTFIGTCWGLCYGYVETEGESYCKDCDAYNPQSTIAQQQLSADAKASKLPDGNVR